MISIFTLTDLFPKQPKVKNIFGLFFKRICCQELSKIAQSSRTGRDTQTILKQKDEKKEKNKRCRRRKTVNRLNDLRQMMISLYELLQRRFHVSSKDSSYPHLATRGRIGKEGFVAKVKKWANPDLFYHLFSVFSNKHLYKFYNKLMSIQYTVPGFEPTTFGS